MFLKISDQKQISPFSGFFYRLTSLWRHMEISLFILVDMDRGDQDLPNTASYDPLGPLL